MNLQPILISGRADLAIQCFALGTVMPSAFNSTDLLTAAWYPVGSSVPLFTPTASWYTAKTTQTGYDQGQVQASVSVAQAAMMVDSVRYMLAMWRAPVGSPSNIDPIVELCFVAKAPWRP